MALDGSLWVRLKGTGSPRDVMVINRSQLARHLRRYIHAQQHREPPGDPDPEEFSRPQSSTRNPDTVPPSDTAQHRLDQLGDDAAGCTLCELSENRQQVVFGEGTARARILVIGEAPGAREDEQGLPFVGPAGELLRKGFHKVGLESEDLYITNTVKCRPPGNRDPRTEELDACRPYLDRQLEIIDPMVVLTLGTFALQYCLGDDRRIGRSRGQVYDWKNRHLVPTYHPAYILRNRSQAKAFVQDLKRARDQLQAG